MRRLLREISVIPGVTGSCIFDKTAGALCSDFSADLPVELTENVGIHFVRLIQMGNMNKLDIKSAHFRFDKYSVVGLPLDTGAILLAICDSEANCSLVATTAAMLAEDMRDELTNPLPEDGEEGVEETAQDTKASAGEQEGTVTVRPQLEEIEKALAAAIGPVAGMVMTDYVNKWIQKGPAAKSRLDELVTMLCEEIGDTNLTKEFQANIRHLR